MPIVNLETTNIFNSFQDRARTQDSYPKSFSPLKMNKNIFDRFQTPKNHR